MENYIPTPGPTLNPRWTRRNRFISDLINQNSTVLDLGCGSKDLLRYLKMPANYFGIDYNQPYADLSINFNNDFSLPKDNWDYIVCSGLLEYLINLDKFFNTIKNNASVYILTFYKPKGKRGAFGNPNTLESVDEFEMLVSKYFDIIQLTQKMKQHNIYVCKDIKC